MKKFIFAFILFLSGASLMAQSGMSYQSIVRNASGSPIVSTTVFLKFAIEDISSGTFLYVETQNPITDTYGWFNVVIGTGTVLSGNFSSIDWTSGPKKLIVSCAPISGGTYTDFSSSVINNSPFIGATGPKGDAGIQGIQGVKGDKGDVGNVGMKGDKGDAGTGVRIVGSVATPADLPIPYSGSIGDVFITQNNGHGHMWNGSSWQDVGEIKGPKGDKGDVGDQGIQGVKGDMGIKGDTGDKGDTGLKGDKGDMGLQGLKGDTGDKGDTGLKGDKGDKGDTGPAGTYVPGTGISISGNTISNSGDVNASDDITTSSMAGGKISGPFSNLSLNPNSVDAVQLASMGATNNQVLTFNGTAWGPKNPVGFTLPYAANFGGLSTAFQLNIQTNQKGLEINNIGLAGITQPAIAASSNGTITMDILGNTTNKFSAVARIHNELPDGDGVVLSAESAGKATALTAHSVLGRAAIFDGQTNKDTAVVQMLNLGKGPTLEVLHSNATSADNAMRINSLTTAPILKIESNRTANQSAATALELKNGYLKVDQTVNTKTAFVHTTTAGNIGGNATTLFYPGASSTDMVFVQKSLPYTGSSVITWYDNVINSWKISNEIIATNMPVGVKFWVFVIKTQ
ncbi:MAG: collagen-like protein [Saprospiraceae bacterium]|nr:collagen-like protein [Candidatus Defluviibacterium haderslevense]